MESKPNPGAFEELARVIATLRIRWQVILIFTLSFGGAAAFLNHFVLQPQYGATALLALSTERFDLNFDPKVRTLPEEPLDWHIRRQTLESLAISGPVAVKVLARMQDSIPPDSRSPLGILRWIDITMDGEILKIHALTSDPSLSQNLAGNWAEALREVVNTSVGAGQRNYKTLEESIGAAEAAYQRAQGALIAFATEDDKNDSLQEELRVKKDRLNRYNNAADRIRRSLSDSERIALELKEGHQKAETIQLATHLAALLIQLNSLESTTKAQEFQLHFEVRAGTSPPANDSLLPDLERLIRNLKVQLDALEKSQALSPLPREIQGLNGELERLSARRKELQVTRDLAWDSYMTIRKRIEENRIAAETAGKLVRLVGTPISNPTPERPRTMLNTLLGTAVGLSLGLLYVRASLFRLAPSL